MSESASNLPLAEFSDAVLIARVRAGDVAAYGTLYERHLGAARGLARHLIDEDAAEDAVQDTFARILGVIRRGRGPRNGFRPYLLIAVRRTVYDRYRGERQSTDRTEQSDPGKPFVDPVLEGLERSMVVRAFQSLPERWQAALWHTEIEQDAPADIAPLLGLSANGVAALVCRAREGLRQAYLRMHLAAASDPGAGSPVVDEQCRPSLENLGAYLRGGLAKRESRSVAGHLDKCDDCRFIYAELADINTSLRGAVAPFILGTAATAYMSSQVSVTSEGLVSWFRDLPQRHRRGLGALTAAATVAAVVLAMTLVSGDHPAIPAGPKSPYPAAMQKGGDDPETTGGSPAAPSSTFRPQPGPAVAASPSPRPVDRAPSCRPGRKHHVPPQAGRNRHGGRSEQWHEHVQGRDRTCGPSPKRALPRDPGRADRDNVRPRPPHRGRAGMPPDARRGKHGRGERHGKPGRGGRHGESSPGHKKRKREGHSSPNSHVKIT